jgi:hypothetical protein
MPRSTFISRTRSVLACALVLGAAVSAQATNPAGIDWLPIAASGGAAAFDIARTETTVAGL